MCKMIDDVFFSPHTVNASYQGSLIDALHYVEKIQFLDPVLWSIFVEQFKLGNTDDRDCGWRGEYWGKMMRGASITYSYTKNRELYNVLEASVKDMLTAQDEYGRFSTYSVEKEFHDWDLWCRKYILLGMQYFIDICEDKSFVDEIISAMCRHADYIISKVGRENEGKIPITQTSGVWDGLNSSSILEPFVRLYKLTGNINYLNFSKEIIDSGGIRDFNIFETVLEKRMYPYESPVTKAYEMISCFEGIIEYYRVTGEEKYKRMAINFASLVMESDITVIGASGTTEELFDHSCVNQFNPKYKGFMQETCVTVTWMKFCYQLLKLTGDSVYADQIEISAYNALMGAVNKNENPSQNGQIFAFDSYSPSLNGVRGLLVGGYKDIIPNRFWWGCCVAIGATGIGMVPMTAIMPKSNGLAVNLYINGSFNTTVDDTDLSLKVETDYPKSGYVKISVAAIRPIACSISLRIPQWSKVSKLRVNNEELTVSNGKYTDIKRIWNNDDVIELELNMRTKIIRAVDIDANSDLESACHFALRRGPVTLARDSQFGEDITEAVTVKDDNGYAVLTECIDTPINCNQCYSVKCSDGASFKVADYASCGQSWDINKPITVWIASR